jgi:hypothetical protein
LTLGEAEECGWKWFHQTSKVLFSAGLRSSENIDMGNSGIDYTVKSYDEDVLMECRYDTSIAYEVRVVIVKTDSRLEIFKKIVTKQTKIELKFPPGRHF